MSTVVQNKDGIINIQLKNIDTDKWLTKQDIENLLVPNEDGNFTKRFIISISIGSEYIIKSSSYTIHDSHEMDSIVPEGVIGYIEANFSDLTQNELAGIIYDDIIITTEDTDITIVLPIEDQHEYQFIVDEELFQNNVSYTLKI